jgi:hypothetical protein
MNAITSEEQKKHLENDFKNQIYEFCIEFKDDICNIIKELNIIYRAIIKSSRSLDEIFQCPLDMIKDVSIIKTENLHKEEFFNAIINDNFIKALIIEVKTKDITGFIELRPIINTIEQDIQDSSKDMKKLGEYLTKLKVLDNATASSHSIIDTSSKMLDEKVLNDLIIQSAK